MPPPDVINQELMQKFGGKYLSENHKKSINI
jgi:hypothetical protein